MRGLRQALLVSSLLYAAGVLLPTVGDAVEQRAGEALAGDDGGPILEGQVRGDDCGAVLVAPAEDVGQKLASGLRQGHVAKLVDDQQVYLGELVLEAQQSLLVARLDHLVDQLRGGGEAHAEALLAGGKPEGEGDTRIRTPRSDDAEKACDHAGGIKLDAIRSRAVAETYFRCGQGMPLSLPAVAITDPLRIKGT